MTRVSRRIALAFVAALLLAVAIGCGRGGGYSSRATSTQPPISTDVPTSVSTSTTTLPTTTGPNEGGEAPIFWRTEDNFTSITVNKPYKMLLRITNGYAEATIMVTALHCPRCPNLATTPLVLTGSRVTPVGEDAPGSYYPITVTLPTAGHWKLTVNAGADSVAIPIDVKAAP